MSESFDPYQKWLGIPPKHQPPNHYRLLGIERFEDDLETIENAADRQMILVRMFASGKHSALSQKILNELSAAKVCLVDPQMKAAYDGELKKRLAPKKSVTKRRSKVRPIADAPAPRPAPSQAAPTAEEFDFTPSEPSRSTFAPGRKTARQSPVLLGGIAAALLAVVVGIVFGVGSGIAPQKVAENRETKEKLTRKKRPEPAATKTRQPNLETRSKWPAPTQQESNPPVAEPSIEKKPPPRVETPLVSGNVQPANWRVRCWTGRRWSDFPLEKMATEIDGGVLRATNTTGLHFKALLYYPLLLDGDFKVVGEIKSQSPYVGIFAVNGEDRFASIVHEHPYDDAWHQFGIERIDGKLTAEADANARPVRFFRAKDDLDAYFCVHIRSGQRVSIRNVRIEAGSVNDTSPLVPSPPLERFPLPSDPAGQQALDLIQDLFETEYAAAKSSPQQSDFAKKLLQQAVEAKDSPVERFVLLQEARRLATEYGDAETALTAVEQLANEYEIEGLKTKVETVMALSETVRITTQRMALAKGSMIAVENAVAANQYDTAQQLADITRTLAQRSARSAADRDFVKQVVARKKKIEEIVEVFPKIKEAHATLEDNPDDPEANLLVGRFQYVVKGDWERGLLMLAKGSDAELRDLAERDLAEPSDANEQIAVADGWWELAENESAMERKQNQLRAGYWYRSALRSTADGIDRARLEERLKELYALLGESRSAERVSWRNLRGVSGSEEGGWTFDTAGDIVSVTPLGPPWVLEFDYLPRNDWAGVSIAFGHHDDPETGVLISFGLWAGHPPEFYRWTGKARTPIHKVTAPAPGRSEMHHAKLVVRRAALRLWIDDRLYADVADDGIDPTGYIRFRGVRAKLQNVVLQTAR